MANPRPSPILSPPWFTLQEKFANIFGCDPAVTVGDLDTSNKHAYVLAIVVDDKNKGIALRTIIRAHLPMGNINVETVVKNSKGELWEAILIANDKQLQEVITVAFTGNPLFVESKKKQQLPGFPVVQVGLIMTTTIVQFFNDNQADFYDNFNGITAQVVPDLIHMSYVNDTVQILMGTAPSKSPCTK